MNRIIDFFTSLKLTVVCLSAALILVFVGTLAQVDQGLYAAQNRYFRSLFVYWTVPGSQWHIPVLPGGYLVGGVLLINLVAAHARRWAFNRKNLGTWLTHAGIMLLLLGQFATDLLQTESHMRLSEGESKNYSESSMDTELAVIDATDPKFDDVVSIPGTQLAQQKNLQHQKWPFTIRVHQYLPNSRLANRDPHKGINDPPAAAQGLGASLILSNAPLSTRMDERNLPSAVVEITTPQGSLGTWLVSTLLGQNQTFKAGDRTYHLDFRFKRYYKPFSLELMQFRHDKYKGTDIPKNFSSRVRVVNSKTGENREVLIYMNNPLRYNGETYYQSGYDERDPRVRVTILQVVRNPSWLTPYISCVMVGVGLMIQFMSHLTYFIAQRRTA